MAEPVIGRAKRDPLARNDGPRFYAASISFFAALTAGGFENRSAPSSTLP
mgnify:CR=1 FL=1